MSQTLSTDEAKIDNLLKILPKKGKSALKRFVKCLRETGEGSGTAHDELADIIEDRAVELKNSDKTSNSTESDSEVGLEAGKGDMHDHS